MVAVIEEKKAVSLPLTAERARLGSRGNSQADESPAVEPRPVAAAIQPAPTPPAVAAVPFQTGRRFNVKRWLAFGILAAAAIGGAPYAKSYWDWSFSHVSTDNAFIDGDIAQVSSRIAGHVAKVYVNDNQTVHTGDLLVELDPADFQAALDEANGGLVAAQADLSAAKSAVEEANAQIAAAEANVAQAKAQAASREAELQRAQADLAQYSRARATAAVSTLEWGKADTNARTAQAAFDAAQKSTAAAEAQVNQAHAAAQARQGQVAVAEARINTATAALEKARLSLSYTKLVAPSDGRVTRKSVEPGNFVIPGQPLFALVSPDVWVTANFKETQLTQMRPGQKAELEVDAYPGMKLHGHVESIQQGAGARFSLLPPENATGNYVKVVQRVPVKIVLDEQPANGRVLGPGMSVTPTIALSD